MDSTESHWNSEKYWQKWMEKNNENCLRLECIGKDWLMLERVEKF